MTTEHHERQLNHRLDKLESRLPGFAASVLAWLRQPRARLVRVPMAVLFIAGGFAGFLPILGFWMLPVGLLLLAMDLPPLRPLVVRMLAWGEGVWGRLKARFGRA